MPKILKGRYTRKYYYCANFYNDFSDLYQTEYISKTEEGLEFLFGMMVFNFPNWSKYTVEKIIKIINIPLADIEVHGIAPDRVNLGIYIDKKINIENCFIAEGIGNNKYILKEKTRKRLQNENTIAMP